LTDSNGAAPRRSDVLGVDAVVPAGTLKPPSSPDAANLRKPSAIGTDNQATTFPANGPLLITLRRRRRYWLYIR
jgi:hypothetical protein